MNIEIKNPVVKNTDTIYVNVPGSKYIPNRALLLAAAAKGESILHGCLTSEDSEYFLKCIKDLGFEVTEIPGDGLNIDVKVKGMGGIIPNKKAELYVGSAGTAARFLVAFLALSDGEYVVNSSEQMKKRPMEPLITALRNAGAEVICTEREGYFPLKITGCEKFGKIPDSFTVDIDKSSQFLSALLIALGAKKNPCRINVTGTHGLGYVAITTGMMKDFGVEVIKEGNSYILPLNRECNAKDYYIEPDMSAAAYFYAAGAILPCNVSVVGVNDSITQSDKQFIDLLCKMGCTTYYDDKGNICLKGAENGLKGGFDVDMSTYSDQALTLGAIAPFADNPITITGIGHIRLQECDRIKAIAENLTALGIRVEEYEDRVTIHPGTPKGAEIETFDDHRVAMSFALTGLKTRGVIIKEAQCCKKTFAGYFEVLEDFINKL